jgi:hypothetical protein
MMGTGLVVSSRCDARGRPRARDRRRAQLHRWRGATRRACEWMRLRSARQSAARLQTLQHPVWKIFF